MSFKCFRKKLRVFTSKHQRLKTGLVKKDPSIDKDQLFAIMMFIEY